MKQQEQNNILIAEFMGYKPSDISAPNYGADWGELMPVVEKIGKVRITDYRNASKYEYSEAIMVLLRMPVIAATIEPVYAACITFIEWHNAQKRETPDDEMVFSSCIGCGAGMTGLKPYCFNCEEDRKNQKRINKLKGTT